MEIHAGTFSVPIETATKIETTEDESGGSLVTPPAQTLKEMLQQMIESEIEMIVSFHTTSPLDENGEVKEGWDTDAIYEGVNAMFPLSEADKQELHTFNPTNSKLNDIEAKEKMIQFLLDKATAEYEKLESQVRSLQPDPEEGEKAMREIEKSVLIRAMDMLWVDHLVEMDYLRTGIGLRGYGQRDPLIEYKKESFALFNNLQANIQKEVVYTFFKVGIGLELAPSIMNEAVQMQGASDSSGTSEAREVHSHSHEGKSKMSKKERRKLKRMEKGI